MEIVFDEAKHEYTVDGVKVPSVTEIISPITASGYSKVNPEILAHAAARGTVVHEWCEMYDYGCADDAIPSELFGYCKAYANFCRDYRPEWISSEEMVFSQPMFGGEKQGDGYAGRLDRFGIIDSVKSVVDIKTIGNPTTKTHISVCCQTIAYAVAIDPKEAEAMNRYALYLRSDGAYRLLDCKDYEAKNSFNALNLFGILYGVHYSINAIGRKKHE